MTLDLPWLNDYFSSLLSEPSDITPQPYIIFYSNLSLASTFLLATVSLGALACILIALQLMCESVKEGIERMRELVYNIFIMNMVMHGCLCLQGSILNQIETFTVNTLFYIIGIVVYLAILLEIIYTIIQTHRLNQQ